MRGIALAAVLCGCAADATEVVDAAERDASAATDEPAPEDSLAGTWGVEFATGCVGGYRFRADRTFTRSLICPGPAGEILAEQEHGTFHVKNGDLYLAVEESTCPDASVRMSFVGYEVLGDSLRLFVDATTTVVFERLPEGDGGSGGSEVIETGCLRADGTFEPMPTQRL